MIELRREETGMDSTAIYDGYIPCCGIYCGGCPNFIRDKNKCSGAEGHCEERRCMICKCCVEKKQLRYCYECKTFPCSRFKKFAETWSKLGQDLIANLQYIQENGDAQLLKKSHIDFK